MELPTTLKCKDQKDNSIAFSKKGEKMVNEKVNMKNGVYYLECQSETIPIQPLILVVQSEVKIEQTGLIVGSKQNNNRFE